MGNKVDLRKLKKGEIAISTGYEHIKIVMRRNGKIKHKTLPILDFVINHCFILTNSLFGNEENKK